MPARKFTEIRDQVMIFEENFLAKHTSFDYIAGEVVEGLPTALRDFHDELRERSWPSGFDVLNASQVNSALTVKDTFEQLYFFFSTKPELFRDIQLYDIYLRCYEKYLPSLSSEVKSALAALNRQHGKLLRAVVSLGEKVLTKEEKA